MYIRFPISTTFQLPIGIETTLHKNNNQLASNYLELNSECDCARHPASRLPMRNWNFEIGGANKRLASRLPMRNWNFKWLGTGFVLRFQTTYEELKPDQFAHSLSFPRLQLPKGIETDLTLWMSPSFPASRLHMRMKPESAARPTRIAASRLPIGLKPRRIALPICKASRHL